MLRNNIVNDGKFAIATYKAAADYKTGMGVVVDAVSGLVSVPTTETSADIYLLDKAPVPTGVNAAKTNFSDYEEEFVTVKENDKCLAVKYVAGESFITDQFDATKIKSSAIGERVAVNTSGKWTVASSASSYILENVTTDNGHAVAVIRVSDTSVANN